MNPAGIFALIFLRVPWDLAKLPMPYHTVLGRSSKVTDSMW